jgi:hypothetical protein
MCTMDLSQLRPVVEVSVGAWIAPRLEPFGAGVGAIVPRGYEAYARVLHPITGANDALMSWADVCASTHHEPHALMAWDDIAGMIETQVDRTVVRTSAWPGQEPEEGNLHPLALRALCRLLEPHTSTADRCFFALWDGYGWIHGSPSVGILRPERSWFPRLTRRLRRHRDRVPPGLPEEVVEASRLQHPGRDYLLFSGSLDAATAMGWQAEDDWFLPQSPNLFWPDDHAWGVATEIDLRSTLVGGPGQLIASILGEVELEAWPVRPDDSVD